MDSPLERQLRDAHQIAAAHAKDCILTACSRFFTFSGVSAGSDRLGTRPRGWHGGSGMNSKSVVGIVVFILSGLGASAVLAGEVNGKGEAIPGGANGASLCSFSGRQDDPEEDEGFFRGDEVQSWGQVPKTTRDFLVSLAMYFHPGEGCNPTRPNPPL